MPRRNQSSAFHRVLVGCDGSPEASDAVALGAALAMLCNAGLTLVGVYAYPLFPMPESWSGAARERETEAILRRERDARARNAHIVAERDSSVPRALRRVARRERADLVVLGSASRAQEGRTEPGPHARQLLHNAPGAAVVAPRGYHKQPSTVLTIAAGYDGGDEARAALRIAAALAQKAGGRVRVHEVVDNRVPLGLNLAVDAIAGRVVDWEALVSHEQNQARCRLEEAAESVSVAVDGTVSVGDPGAELRKLSEEVDLIVLGSLRLARRERLGIGATAESVLDGAGCPVLVVPRPLAGELEPSLPRKRSRRSPRPAGNVAL
jgi:nucleotide-binding universal stress UspA family protein